MDLRIIDEPEEVAKLLGLEDDIETYIDGERGEWIQWLVEQKRLKNDKVVIWIAYEDEDIKGYMVMFDNRLLPVMNNLFIFYATSSMNHYLNKSAVEQILDWAKTQEVSSITAVTNNPKMLEKYGFEQESYKSMKLEL